MDIGDVHEENGRLIVHADTGFGCLFQPFRGILEYCGGLLADAAVDGNVEAADKALGDILHLATCAFHYAKQTRATMNACAKPAE